MLRLLLPLLAISLLRAAEVPPPPLAEGATKDIQYLITRSPGDDAHVVVRLSSRLGYDARITFSVIAGVGDRGDEPQRVVLIPRDGSWNASGRQLIATTFARPGLRVDLIERGVMEQEEGTFYDAEGNETWSRIYRFRLLPERAPAQPVDHHPPR